jgi:hypothetical protein
MHPDDHIVNLTNHLTANHQDQVRLQGQLERLIEAIRDNKKESYEINMILASFTAEARLLVNDRIGEMSVERLAELLPRHKIDQVRALLYAREKGIEDVPPDLLSPEDLRRTSSLRREPTLRLPVQEVDDERRDPWYARLLRAVLRTPPMTLLVLGLLVIVATVAMTAGLRLLQALDHSHLLGEPQHHAEPAKP